MIPVMGTRSVERSEGNAKKLDERARAHGVSIWLGEQPSVRIWGMSGVTFLVEYKRPGKPVLDAETWKGNKVAVVETVEDVDAVVALMRKIGRVLQVMLSASTQ